MKELDIRYTQLSEISYLLNWLKNEDTLQWFPFSSGEELELSAKNWIGFSRFNASLTGVLNNQVCAIGSLFLFPYVKIRHLCMFYLVVDPNFRRKGVGEDMVKNLLHLAKNYFRLDSVYVEVFESCPIISVLEKFKFQKITTQKHFIKEENKYKSRILFDIWF